MLRAFREVTLNVPRSAIRIWPLSSFRESCIAPTKASSTALAAFFEMSASFRHFVNQINLCHYDYLRRRAKVLLPIWMQARHIGFDNARKFVPPMQAFSLVGMILSVCEGSQAVSVCSRGSRDRRLLRHFTLRNDRERRCSTQVNSCVSISGFGYKLSH